MKVFVALCALISVAVAEQGYGNNCYNCETTLTHSYDAYGKPSTQQSYPACLNPSPHNGVDIWQCSTKCFTSYDEKTQTLKRGCFDPYRDAGVNPHAYGCQKVHTRTGYGYNIKTYCFCDSKGYGYGACNDEKLVCRKEGYGYEQKDVCSLEEGYKPEPKYPQPPTYKPQKPRYPPQPHYPPKQTYKPRPHSQPRYPNPPSYHPPTSYDPAPHAPSYKPAPHPPSYRQPSYPPKQSYPPKNPHGVVY